MSHMHTHTHRQITSAIFVLPADLVPRDGGAAWAMDQQATGEKRTDRAERRKFRTREEKCIGGEAQQHGAEA